ncbi:MAG: pyruvate kinase [Bacteroidia bacterium]|nr:pyruvate kinase [Bacteroidia bacterium]MCF8427318.1 pyruvate kinase [Bacteroidia bacterium]MCF8446231.1 pyruvate kinase [Bacteroidia bacterium]
MSELNFNRTKIIATIGPATSSYENLKSIVKEGVDVCRLNFSHGSYDDHKVVIDNINKLNEEMGTNVCMLLDLQGPKLRVGEMENGKIELKTGSTIEVTTEKMIGTAEKIYVNFENLPKDVNKGERILLDDGKLELRVLETNRKNLIKAEIIVGGFLTNKKGFNLPNTKMSIPSMTQKDLDDLKFGLEQKVEWVALSFVRNADDVIFIKNIIELNEWKPRVIAKIEKPEAIVNIDRIIQVSDGIMVARGDLGVEMPMEQVPVLQKTIVKKCIEASKPVIIATQMMESMITSAVPTRAEVNDVANAVMDGADAVMLSAETSVGAFPQLCVRAMQKTIAQVEQKTNAPYFKGKRPDDNSPTFISDEILFTAVRISDHLKASAVVGMTFSGYSAYRLSSYRPKSPIFIFTTNPRLLKTMSLVWGVRGFLYRGFDSTDSSIQDVNDQLKEMGLVKSGDIVINTASMPIINRSRTNAVKISEIE